MTFSQQATGEQSGKQILAMLTETATPVILGRLLVAATCHKTKLNWEYNFCPLLLRIMTLKQVYESKSKTMTAD